MKIICTQENLKNGLLTVGRIISSSNSLPILNNILIKSENGLLKLSSTNLEIGITTYIRCKIEEEGEITILCKTITELIGSFPNQNIELKTENGQMKVETENYHTQIKTLPAEEFPLIPVLENNNTLELDAQELKQALDQVVFAVSTNQTQPEISGVLLSFEGKNLTIAATDRYRLAERKLVLPKNDSGDQQIIVPHKTILEISRVIGGQKGNIEVKFTTSQIAFKFNNTEIISRLVDGQYPDYKQIIPTEFPTQVTVKKPELLSALKASSIFSQTSNSVKFEYGDNSLKLSTESQDLGKSEVDIAATVEGKSGMVMLNYHYIIDCLNSISSENVIMKIIDDSSPSLILPESQSDYLYLVMPIKS